MGRPISKTTKFILALPGTLSAKEVLSKAKASGHNTSEGNVHRVRRLHGGKKSTAKKTSTATPTAAPSSRLPQSKADFVRSLPSSTPAKKVIAQAKAAGLSVSETYVYALRRSAKSGTRKKATKGPARRATKPASATSSKPTLPLKSEFVRGFSRSTTAKDVVAKAKAAGIKLDIQYVYKLRSRSRSGRKKVAVAKPAQVISAKTKTNGFHSSTEDLLRAVAAELGLGHALEILQSQRAQVRAVLGG
jgi:hypothetical protein